MIAEKELMNVLKSRIPTLKICCSCQNPFEQILIENDCKHMICFPCAKSKFELSEQIKFCPILTCTKQFNTSTLNLQFQERYELTELVCSICNRSPENWETLYQNAQCGHRSCYECSMNTENSRQCPANNCEEKRGYQTFQRYLNQMENKIKMPDMIRCQACNRTSKTIFYNDLLYTCAQCEELYCLESQKPLKTCQCICTLCEKFKIKILNKQFKYCPACQFICEVCQTKIPFQTFIQKKYFTGNYHCNIPNQAQLKINSPKVSCGQCGVQYIKQKKQVGSTCYKCSLNDLFCFFSVTLALVKPQEEVN